MAKDPNKFQFNDREGNGWKRDTNLSSPTYGKWVLFQNWTKIEGSAVDSLNPFAPLVSGAKNISSKLNKLRIDQIARTQAKNKLMIDQGYFMDKRGRWRKPNPFTSVQPSDLDNEEVVNENIVEEEDDKKIVVPPSPVDIAAVKKYTEKKEDDGYAKTQNFVSDQPVENDPYTQLSNAVSNLTGLKINQDNNNNTEPVEEEKPKKTEGTMYGLLISEYRKANKDQKRRARNLSSNNSRVSIRGDGMIGVRNTGLNPGGRDNVRINKGNTNSAWYMSS